MKNAMIVFWLAFVGPALATDDIETDPAELQAATRINAIGAELLTSRLRHEAIDNLMVSSVSLFYALSVLELGADGKSRQLLVSRLLTDPDTTLTGVAPQLAAQLASDNRGGNGMAGAFRLSNSLWSANGGHNGRPFPLAESFVNSAAALYGAGHQSLDFKAPGASRAVNEWTNEQTRGLIPNIVDDGLLARLEWIILNTALFEGAWGTPMQRVTAQDDYRFTALDGSARPAETLRTQDYVSQVVDLVDGSVVFQLPFAGDKYAFVVHAPAPDQVDIGSWLQDNAVPHMAHSVAQVLARSGAPNQLSIQLPIFSFDDSITLHGASPTAQEMGLAQLFDSDANLSRLSAQHSRVSIIRQNTRIEMDENGVRAAAATLAGGVRATTEPRLLRRTIVVNRPFAFAIVETASQTLLFNGVLASPPHN